MSDRSLAFPLFACDLELALESFPFVLHRMHHATNLVKHELILGMLLLLSESYGLGFIKFLGQVLDLIVLKVSVGLLVGQVATIHLLVVG